MIDTIITSLAAFTVISLVVYLGGWDVFENFVITIGEAIDDNLDRIHINQFPSIKFIGGIIAVSAIIGVLLS